MKRTVLGLIVAMGFVGCDFSSELRPVNSKIVYSPDGKHLLCAFQAANSLHTDDRTGIYRMNSDWTNPVRLTAPPPPGFDSDPVYSPDGLKIAFSGHLGDSYIENVHLYIMNADGRHQVQLTAGSEVDGDPVFSPDGQQIYFTRTWYGGYGASSTNVICSVRADGTPLPPLQRITPNYNYFEGYAVSPDGKSLVIAGIRSGDVDRRQDRLVVFSLEAQKEIGVIQPNITQYFDPSKKIEYTIISHPTYSPDEKYLIFETNTWLRQGPNQDAVYRFNLQNQATERIMEVPSGIYWASISPDWGKIIFCTSLLPAACRDLWMTNLDGASSRKLSLDFLNAF